MKNLATALCAFQAEVGNIPKDSTNPFYKSKYASLESVITTIKPILAKHGLSFSQLPDGAGLKTILFHTSGETLEATMTLVVKEQTPQSQGSSLTYARRYALSAMLGLATDEDDDANEATKPTQKVEAPKPTAKPVPPKSVTDLTKQRKTRVKELVDGRVLVPLETKQEYEDFVKQETTLDLIDSNLVAIIERLEALERIEGIK